MEKTFETILAAVKAGKTIVFKASNKNEFIVTAIDEYKNKKSGHVINFDALESLDTKIKDLVTNDILTHAIDQL